MNERIVTKYRCGHEWRYGTGGCGGEFTSPDDCPSCQQLQAQQLQASDARLERQSEAVKRLFVNDADSRIATLQGKPTLTEGERVELELLLRQRWSKPEVTP